MRRLSEKLAGRALPWGAEFRAVIDALIAEDDAAAKGTGRHLMPEGASAEFLAERRARGVRALDGPRDVYFVPIIASQEVGWDITPKDVLEARNALPGSTRSDVTEWAASLFATGGML